MLIEFEFQHEMKHGRWWLTYKIRMIDAIVIVNSIFFTSSKNLENTIMYTSNSTQLANEYTCKGEHVSSIAADCIITWVIIC